MHIINRLSPDEEEFYDYFMKNKLLYLKDFIEDNKFIIEFTGMLPIKRSFVVGFSSNSRYPHERPEHIVTFKVNHNHGHYLVYDIRFESKKIEELEDDNLFYIQPLAEYENILI